MAVLLLTATLQPPAKGQVISLKLDGTDALTIHGVKDAEYVEGVMGKALRTDGYSTFATTEINAPAIDASTFSMSLWVAPETYPMMNVNEAEMIPTFAVMVGNIDDKAKTGFAFELSSQGTYRFRCYANGWASSVTSETKLPCYQWSHLVVVRNGRRLYLYNNGTEVARGNMGNLLSQGSGTFYIGKSAEELKAYHLFNLNTFNGLLDDFEVYNTVLAGPQLAGTDVTPDLSVPAIRFSADIFRPKFHGMPSANWTNESHGLTYYNGKYHLFFQKNANGPYMARLNWGHLTSDDLVSWTEEKIALSPGENYDMKGCWSGALMSVDGIPNIIYTGVDNGQARIIQAAPNDQGLIAWTKKGVIIDGRPSGLSDDFRDPYCFEAHGNKFMVVGTAKGGVGACTLHRFVNGQWTNDGTMFYQGTSASVHGTFWEMPTVTPIGDKWLFTITPQNTGNGVKTLYWVGSIKADGTFSPDFTAPRELELMGISHDGYGLLSPSIMQKDGKTILMGIVPDKVVSEYNYDWGWAHTYSLPREVSLAADGSLVQKPFVSFTNAAASATDLQLTGTQTIAGVSGRQWEVEGEFVIGSSVFGFNFLRKDDKMGKIYYNPADGTVTVDLAGLPRIVNDAGIYDGIYRAALPKKPAVGESLKMHVFFDHSILDVFINDTYAFSMRVFATDASANGVEVFAFDTTTVRHLTGAVSTKIDNFRIQNDSNDNWYSLAGAKVKSPVSKGIYIKKGKKYMFQ